MDGFSASSPNFQAGERLESEIQRKIRSGEWPVDFRLPGERVLSAEFGVSRAIVREVLQTLEGEGVVRIEPARGAFVARPDGTRLAGALSRLIMTQGATVRNVADVRTLLEVEIAGYVADARGRGLLNLLYATADDVDGGTDRVNQAIADLKFHSLLAVLSDNPVLSAMHRALAPHILFMMLRSDRVREPNNVSHRSLTESIEAGDVDLARKLARAHVAVTERHFGNDFERPVEQVAAENLDRITSGLWTLRDVERVAFAELDRSLTAARIAS